MTDALKVLTENTKRFNGGASMRVRYAELIDTTPKDERTEDEVVVSIVDKLKAM